MIQPDKKPDPKFGMAMGASRGMRGGSSGEAVQRGYREGIPSKPKIDASKLPDNGLGPASSAYRGAIAGYSKKAVPYMDEVEKTHNKKEEKGEINPNKKGGHKIKPEAIKAYLLAKGKR